VALSVGPGEVVCLLGPNGSGKSTLFRTLLGLIPAQAGRILLDGEPLAGLGRAAIARRIAYVPQAQSTQFSYSVLDVALMGRAAHLGPFSAPGDNDVDAARTALASLGIDALADADYSRISGGQRQLALIARALAQAAPLLIMDEPTASLDFGNQAVVLRQVRRLRERGLGIVLSTHDPDQAFACATSVALLNAGRIIAQGPAEDVLTSARLEMVYGVRVTIDRLADGRVVVAPSLDTD
jgi:iron complex transport system ATP-binding protein